MTDRVAIASITRIAGGGRSTDQDLVAAEAPLTIELRQPAAGERRTLGVLMRTPGDDDELVLGLLHGEEVIRSRADVVALRASRTTDERAAEPAAEADVMDVELAAHIDLAGVPSRAMAATSACGLCGRLDLQRIARRGSAPAMTVTPEVIARLPETLRSRQSVFAETGGLHAAALVDAAGRCLVLREDVGRHNAVDKVFGHMLGTGRLPVDDAILALSGRVAFEIVQKAVLAGVPIVAAVGAPSSLAVDAARAAGLTLIGFVRDGRFNVYTGAERVR